MIENWNDVHIVPEFSDQGVDCYRLAGGSFVNEYYIVSEAETRKLMNHPEVVGYEVYASLVTATSQMMYYLKEQKYLPGRACGGAGGEPEWLHRTFRHKRLY